MVGQHRELRGTPKPLSDTVTHSVPDGQHAFELDDGILVNQTRGEPIIQESPEAPSDIAYRSPNNLSYERAVGLQESKKRMRIERDSWQTTAAAYSAEIDRLADMILNREWSDKNDLMELLREYEEMQRERSSPDVVDNRSAGVSRSSSAEGSSILQEHRDSEGGDES